MKYYELTINTKESESLLEKVASYLPNPPMEHQKGPSWLSLKFYAGPEKIAELEKKLQADSLKYIVLVKEPLEKTAEVSQRPRRTIRQSEPKVELKEIEKKLEEILKE
jgi:hypothetical protein